MTEQTSGRTDGGVETDGIRSGRDAGREARGRVLAVVSSHGELGDTGYPTGWWVSELAHPYLALTSAGYEVDVASPAGGAAPVDAWSDPNDEAAQTPDDFVSTGFLENRVTREKVEHTRRLTEVDPGNYDAVFVVGGYGAVYDLADDPDLRRIAREVWEAGGVVGSICHGAACLPSLTDASGRPLIEGREVTGFSKAEDREVEATVGADFLDDYVEDRLRGRGATYVHGDPFEPFAVTSADGRLVTGQQQFSGEVFGEQLVEALEARRAARAGAV